MIVLAHSKATGNWQVLPNAINHHGVATDGEVWDRVLEITEVAHMGGDRSHRIVEYKLSEPTWVERNSATPPSRDMVQVERIALSKLADKADMVLDEGSIGDLRDFAADVKATIDEAL